MTNKDRPRTGMQILADCIKKNREVRAAMIKDEIYKEVQNDGRPDADVQP